jgi:ribonuclease T2
LKALYVRAESELANDCTDSAKITEFCLASIRNNPEGDVQPAFVAWPTNVTQIQTLVKFSKKHNLCLSVAGTGHEMLRRHTCQDGLFIRTTLMKGISWDLTDSRGYGHADGNVKVGSGIVFSEIQTSAATNDRFIASGWCPTVGVAGFFLGGGHGPFAPSKGLGVDQLLEVEIVTADGNLTVANSK